jgi:hypothetical protein
MSETAAKAALRTATGELEERVWRRIVSAAPIAMSSEEVRLLHRAIMSDILLILSEAAEKIAALSTPEAVPVADKTS